MIRVRPEPRRLWWPWAAAAVLVASFCSAVGIGFVALPARLAAAGAERAVIPDTVPACPPLVRSSTP